MIFTCDPEAAMLADLIAQQAAEERDRDAGLDLYSRIVDGPCDLCREDSAVGLVLIGGDALCPGCTEALGVDFNKAREEAWIQVRPTEVG